MMELRFRMKNFKFGKFRFELMQNIFILSYFTVFRFF